jgi:predicted metalloprotease
MSLQPARLGLLNRTGTMRIGFVPAKDAMRTDGSGSDNIEDRRGMGGRLGGRLGGRRAVGGGIGLVIAVVAALLFGIDPRVVLGLFGAAQTMGGAAAPVAVEGKRGTPADEAGRFVSGVLADTEKTWGQLFAKGGGSYREPVLVLFEGATPSACGVGQSAMGPFYCPLDQKLYLDLGKH